jgi:hypothetical protein
MPDNEDAYTITVTVTWPGFTVDECKRAVRTAVLDLDLTSTILDTVRTQLDSRVDTDGARIRVRDISDF